MLWGNTVFSRIFSGILYVLSLILYQTYVSDAVSILGIKFDLSMVILVYIALSRGPVSGAIFGFILGLLADVFTPQTLGFGALVKCLIGFSVGSFKDSLYLDSWYSKGGMIFFALIINDLLYYLLTRGLNASTFETLINYSLLSAVYTSVVGIFIFLISGRFNWNRFGVERKMG